MLNPEWQQNMWTQIGRGSKGILTEFGKELLRFDEVDAAILSSGGAAAMMPMGQIYSVGAGSSVAIKRILKALNKVRKSGRKLVGKTSKNSVKWVDENAHMSNRAKLYNDSATGARSNITTQKGQAPQITRTLDDGSTKGVRFVLAKRR